MRKFGRNFDSYPLQDSGGEGEMISKAFTRGKSRGSRGGRGGGRTIKSYGDKREITCYNCGEKGHGSR